MFKVTAGKVFLALVLIVIGYACLATWGCESQYVTMSLLLRVVAALGAFQSRQRPAHVVPAFGAAGAPLAAVTPQPGADQQQANGRNQRRAEDVHAGTEEPVSHGVDHTALRLAL